MKHSIFIFSILFVVACNPKHPQISFEYELDSLLEKEFSGDEPGGSFVVMKGDSTVYLKSFGLADLETKEKITPNTLFNIGSISKTFVAYGILKLVEENRISLEDSIYKYFPDFDNPGIARKVKIKHLLSHTSGLPDIRDNYGDSIFYLAANDLENFEPIKRAQSFNFEPGEKYEYSNPAFNGLALVIEQVTGTKWQEYIINNIFIPSGMITSTITDGPHPESGVAHAYIKEGTVYKEFDYGECPKFAAAGNGGVWSSVLELAKYENAIKNNVFLNKELTAESRTVFSPSNWADTIKPYIGFSWFLDQDFLFRGQHTFDTEFVYHTGSQGGFLSIYLVIPEKEILFIGLFNRPSENFRNIITEACVLFEKYNHKVIK
ncbi:MAG: beta-lactamase family protein [Bacteroidales bacterium]|nr:beta-lactamase family protein [Bacteroidales bacterium]